ncbi:hypothetical protein E0494_04580 [Marinilabiliaceae bacterium JC040]|nr:hypothetical protein [Marinilabiliaceae bacterium JC040]
MGHNYENEFETVKLILNSNSEVKGVDAFVLSLIKSERQMRKIFTFLVYQNFNKKDVNELRCLLAKNRKLYFNHFVLGVNILSDNLLKNQYGDSFDNDYLKMEKMKIVRNKIFHGQISDKGITRSELIDIVEFIMRWCRKISEIMLENIGYDGFARNSYQKSKLNIKDLFKFNNISEYDFFLRNLSKK